MTENKPTKRLFVKQFASSKKERVGFDFVMVGSPLEDLAPANRALHSIAEVNNSDLSSAMSPKVLANSFSIAGRQLGKNVDITQSVSIQDLSEEEIQQITGKVMPIKTPRGMGLVYATIVEVGPAEGIVLAPDNYLIDEDEEKNIIPFDPNYRARLVRSGVTRVIEGIVIEPANTKELKAA